MDNTVVFESTATFSVPNRVVDYYLKAPDVELRLILFLLRNTNASFTKDQLMKALDETEERIDKAFKYWCAAGILFKTGNKYISERPKLLASDIVHYSADQIASRLTEDAQLKFLYQCAETALAKPLTATDASIIFSLVDWNGLPADAAAMLIQYCASKGKGMGRIQKMGIEWAEKGIDTYEKAEEYIKNEQERADIIHRTASVLGVQHRALTDTEKKIFFAWYKELNFGLDIVKLAYERMISSTGNYKYQYMETILRSWFSSGYHTVEEILENDDGSGKKRGGRKTTKQRYESDINKKDLQSSVNDSWAIIEAELDEGK